MYWRSTILVGAVSNRTESGNRWTQYIDLSVKKTPLMSEESATDFEKPNFEEKTRFHAHTFDISENLLLTKIIKLFHFLGA